MSFSLRASAVSTSGGVKPPPIGGVKAPAIDSLATTGGKLVPGLYEYRRSFWASCSMDKPARIQLES